MHESITYIQIGTEGRKILVMSPVMPTWDGGAFFQPLTNYFQTLGYSLLIVDTLSLPLCAAEPISSFAQRWAEQLLQYGPFEIIAGCALGGAIAQTLTASDICKDNIPCLLISAPNYSDARLERRLGSMIQFARDGDLQQAIKLLSHLVHPEKSQPIPPTDSEITFNDTGRCRDRLDIGFSYLLNLDIRQYLDRYKGRVLNIIGERSQLVCIANVKLNGRPEQKILIIPGGGMRPLTDNISLVISTIDEYLMRPGSLEVMNYDPT